MNEEKENLKDLENLFEMINIPDAISDEVIAFAKLNIKSNPFYSHVFRK